MGPLPADDVTTWKRVVADWRVCRVSRQRLCPVVGHDCDRTSRTESATAGDPCPGGRWANQQGDCGPARYLREHGELAPGQRLRAAGRLEPCRGGRSRDAGRDRGQQRARCGIAKCGPVAGAASIASDAAAVVDRAGIRVDTSRGARRRSAYCGMEHDVTDAVAVGPSDQSRLTVCDADGPADQRRRATFAGARSAGEQSGSATIGGSDRD